MRATSLFIRAPTLTHSPRQVFAGDLQSEKVKENFTGLVKMLDSPASPVRRYTPKSADLDSVIETLVVVSSSRVALQNQVLDWPEVLLPHRAPHKIQGGCLASIVSRGVACSPHSLIRDAAFDTVFADVDSYHHGHGHAYQKYGIDPEVGCVVVTRPDQHVAGVYSVNDFEAIGETLPPTFSQVAGLEN